MNRSDGFTGATTGLSTSQVHLSRWTSIVLPASLAELGASTGTWYRDCSRSDCRSHSSHSEVVTRVHSLTVTGVGVEGSYYAPDSVGQARVRIPP